MDQSGEATARRIQRIEARIEQIAHTASYTSDWIGYQREQNLYVTGRLDRLERQIAQLEARVAATAVEPAVETPEISPADLLPPRIEPFGEQRPAVAPEPAATPHPVTEPVVIVPESVIAPQPAVQAAAPQPAPARPAPPPRPAPKPRPRREPDAIDRFIARVTEEVRAIQLPTIDFQIPRTREGLEQLVGRRLLALIGGIAILIGAAFFLSLAFGEATDGGKQTGPFFSDTAYVVIGLFASVLLVGLGAWAFERREPILGHVMVASGIATYAMTLLSGTPAIIPIEISLIGLLGGALASAVIAIRANSQVVAAFGLLSTLIAPPLLGADPDGMTVAYVGIMLVGTTAIALYRTWNWLPAIAFLLAAPQFLLWINDGPATTVGLAATAGFWLINAIAAGGEEFRIRRQRLWFTSATLLLLNAAVTVTAGYLLFQSDFEDWDGALLAALALGHFAIGGYFMRTEGHRNPFGLLAFGTGLAAFSAAIPVQLGGPAVPIIWAAEAAALVWVYSKLRNRYSIAASALLGAAALVHLLLFVYQPLDVRAGFEGSENLNAALALVSVLAAAAVSAYFVGSRQVRHALALGGFALLVYALPFNLSGAWLVGGWALLSVIALADPRRLHPRLPSIFPAGYPMLALGGLTSLLASLHLFLYDYPFLDIEKGQPSEWPFISWAGLAALFLLASRAATAYLSSDPRVKLAGTMTTLALPLYVLPFELSTAGLIGGWALVFAAAMIDPRRIPFPNPIPDRYTLLPVAAIAGALALGHFLVVEYPLDLIAEGFTSRPFMEQPGLALAFVLLATSLAGYLTAFRSGREYFAIAALLLTAYTLPFELSGWAVVAGWAALMLIALVEPRQLPFRYPLPTRRWLPYVGALTGALAAGNLAFWLYPFGDFLRGVDPRYPFWHEPGLALGILLAALGLAAWLTSARWLRGATILTIGGLLIWTLPFELSGAALVAGWVLLFAAGSVRADRLPIALWRRFLPHTIEPLLTIPALLAGGLALLHLILVDYSLAELGDGLRGVTPFWNEATLALGILLAGLWLAGFLTTERLYRTTFALAGYGILLFALPFELSGPALVGAWAIVALLALVEQDCLPNRYLPFRHPLPIGFWTLVPAAAATALAAIHLTTIELPWWNLPAGPQTLRLPLWNGDSLSAAFIILAAALAALVARRSEVRHGAIFLGLTVASYLTAFQFSSGSAVIVWSAIGLLPYVFAGLDRRWRNAYYGYAGMLVALASTVAIVAAAPPVRLIVQPSSTVDHPLLFSAATAALGAIIVNLLVACWTFRERRQLASLLIVATGALAIYLLSVGLVDEFQRRVSAADSASVLQEKASVGLSILWASIGVAALVAGIWRRVLGLRLFSLGVLALAIVKVFVVDLASVDTSRKFFSFIILGILLLLSSFLYQKLNLRENGSHGAAA